MPRRPSVPRAAERAPAEPLLALQGARQHRCTAKRHRLRSQCHRSGPEVQPPLCFSEPGKGSWFCEHCASVQRRRPWAPELPLFCCPQPQPAAWGEAESAVSLSAAWLGGTGEKQHLQCLEICL